jgi:hypothetical protein
MKLVAKTSGFDEQRLALGAQQVEDGSVVVGVDNGQRRRFAAHEARNRACIEPISLVEFLGPPPPKCRPARVDFVDRFARGNEVLEDVEGLAKTLKRSVFFAAEDPLALITDAVPVASYPQRNGNIERIVVAGRTVGYDYYAKEFTDVYTVITTSDNHFVTFFPGIPQP